ncbi:unnamed protein product, partial [Prorocentrum cordatum]
MTLQEISPKCVYSRDLLNQLAAWCPTLETELCKRCAEQTLFVQTARATQRPDVEQVPERSLQQDFPRGLRFVNWQAAVPLGLTVTAYLDASGDLRGPGMRVAKCARRLPVRLTMEHAGTMAGFAWDALVQALLATSVAAAVMLVAPRLLMEVQAIKPAVPAQCQNARGAAAVVLARVPRLGRKQINSLMLAALVAELLLGCCQPRALAGLLCAALRGT